MSRFVGNLEMSWIIERKRLRTHRHEDVVSAEYPDSWKPWSFCERAPPSGRKSRRVHFFPVHDNASFLYVHNAWYSLKSISPNYRLNIYALCRAGKKCTLRLFLPEGGGCSQKLHGLSESGHFMDRTENVHILWKRGNLANCGLALQFVYKGPPSLFRCRLT